MARSRIRRPYRRGSSAKTLGWEVESNTASVNTAAGVVREVILLQNAAAANQWSNVTCYRVVGDISVRAQADVELVVHYGLYITESTRFTFTSM